jgi:hypothetical protein
MLLFNLDEIKILASIVDRYFCDRTDSYKSLMEDLVLEYVDPLESLIEFFGYIITSPREQIEESLEQFFQIPLEQIPLYVFPKPYSQRKESSTLCPSLEEGPYPWQAILAQWRIKIQR